jgi:hypothetical protein
MAEEDDWPKKRHKAEDMPADDGRLGRATALVYTLAGLAILAAIAFAVFF